MRGLTCAVIAYVLIYTASKVHAKNNDKDVIRLKGLHVVLAWMFLLLSAILTIFGL